MSFKSAKMCSTASVVVMLSLIAASNSRAQTPATGPQIEEVVVTARKTAESQQSVPVAITALSQAGLERQVVHNVQDLQTSVPGLFVAPNSQGGAPTFAIRAAKADNGTSATVTTYINDMPTTTTLAVANMVYDMQSVTTLKGPQGTLFGANSTGGAIIFRPNTPSDALEGYLQGGLGNWRRRDAQAMINIPVNDKLQIRLAGDLVRRKGFVHNHTSPATGLAAADLSDDRHESGRLSIRFTPTDQIQNDLMIDRFTENDHPRQAITVALRSRYVYPTFLGFGAPVDYAKAGIFPPNATSNVAVGPQALHNKDRIWDITNSTTVHFSQSLEGKLALGWEDAKLDTFENNSGVIGNIVNTRTRDWLSQVTVEPSLDYTGLDNRLRVKAGAYYSKEHRVTGNSAAVVGLPFDLSALPPVEAGLVPVFYPLLLNNLYVRDLESKALYTQWSYDITDHITGTLGGRYTWDTGAYTTTGFIGFGAAAVQAGFGQFGSANGVLPCAAGIATYQDFNPATCTGHQSYKSSSPSYTATLEDKIGPGTMAYLTLRTGYLVGGFNNQVYVPGGFAQVFAPEKVKSAEIGLKSDWDFLGRPIRTNLDLFAGKYKDQQRVQNGTTSEGTTFIAVQNAGSSTFYGSDVEIVYNVTRDFQVSGSYQYIHATYDTYHGTINIPGVDNAYVDLHGQRLSQTPDHVITLAGTYNVPMPASYGDVSATLSYFWRSQTAGHDSPTVAGPVSSTGQLLAITDDFSQFDQLPAFGLVNLSIDWRKFMGSKVDVVFWAKNLLDRTYAIYQSNQMLQFGYATYTYGNPREFGVDVRYSF